MKVQCPKCSAAYQIDKSKLPPKGAYGRCPKCQTRFLVKKEAVPRDRAKWEDNKICPKCGYERQPSDVALDYKCPLCGVVYSEVSAKTREGEAKQKLRAVAGHQRKLGQQGVQKRNIGKRKKIITISISLILITVYFGAKLYVEKAAKTKIDNAIAKLGDVVNIDYENINADLLRLNLHIQGVSVSRPEQKEKVNITDIIIYDIDSGSRIPSYLNLEINGIRGNAGGLGGLGELGYNTIEGDIELDYRYDGEKKEFQLNKFKCSAAEMEAVETSFHLGNVHINQKNILALLFGYPQILLYQATLNYKDNSLVPRLFELGAKKNGKGVNDFKLEIIQKIDHMISKEGDEVSAETLRAIKGFIDDPKKIEISASPRKPVPIGFIQGLKDFRSISKFLNLKITK